MKSTLCGYCALQGNSEKLRKKEKKKERDLLKLGPHICPALQKHLGATLTRLSDDEQQGYAHIMHFCLRVCHSLTCFFSSSSCEEVMDQ